MNAPHVEISGDPIAGTRNLLKNCAGLAVGDRVLVAFEDHQLGYFSRDIGLLIETGAQALGINLDWLDVGYDPACTALPAELAARCRDVDAVLFIARLGDQLRFCELPEGPKFIVCFAFNGQLLGSPFCTADYRAFLDIKTALDARLFSGSQITVTCPAGTRVEGRVPPSHSAPSDTSSSRFPQSVFSPVPAMGFSGQVALAGFLTGTGSRYYDDYTIGFDAQVIAHFQQGRLTGFSGSTSDVAKANAQYDRIAGQFGLDRDFVHSWHAGIHPGCGFPWDMRGNDLRWGGAAFGNPRILHFHTCGAFAPGEISWNVLDPTIEVDGLRIWENGYLLLDRLAEGRDILARYPCTAEAFANPDRNVGLGPLS